MRMCVYICVCMCIYVCVYGVLACGVCMYVVVVYVSVCVCMHAYVYIMRDEERGTWNIFFSNT